MDFFYHSKNKRLKFKTQEHVQVYLKYSNNLLCGKLLDIKRNLDLISTF